MSPSWNSDTGKIDLAGADELALRYDAFLGDVTFRIDSIDFSTDWGWVPILDFAMGLENVLAELNRDGHSIFEFTESDHELRFVRESDLVFVEATYKAGGARVSLEELRSAVSDFSKRVRDQFCDQWPELRSNRAIQRWLEAGAIK